ncbi:MAG TPA: polysaccharide deacetylase family protein [Thermoleophilaceae bacterium]|nr:polysaccharide deacetylase family protein [Thermoleophilaceae bacterium]
MPSFQEQLDTLARWRRYPGRERLDPGTGQIALTFDDGPDPDATPAVLDALGDVPATFFLVGEQVEVNPALAREVAERGHAVALHGQRHIEHDRLGDGARADLERGLATLQAATGARPRLFRPPYGRFSAASYAACRELGLEPVLWSAWGGDWEPVPEGRIADLVCRDLADGAVVLLHDSARYAYRQSAQPTAAALPAILGAIDAAGLRPVPLAP